MKKGDPLNSVQTNAWIYRFVRAECTVGNLFQRVASETIRYRYSSTLTSEIGRPVAEPWAQIVEEVIQASLSAPAITSRLDPCLGEDALALL